jgi:outer membrane protein OmpA-like peptidoglycan-associated protein
MHRRIIWAVGVSVPILVAGALSGCAQTTAATRPATAAAGAAGPDRRCEDTSFPVYFRTGSAALTDPAIQAIRMTADQTKGCQALEVRVMGLADADGGAQRNQDLSRARAETVAAALAAQGFPAPAYDIEASGSAGSKTPLGAIIPSRRRAEVVIRFKH